MQRCELPESADSSPVQRCELPESTDSSPVQGCEPPESTDSSPVQACTAVWVANENPRLIKKRGLGLLLTVFAAHLTAQGMNTWKPWRGALQGFRLGWSGGFNVFVSHCVALLVEC